MEQARYDLGASWREAVWRDVRYGVRMLRNAPGFTAIAIITLALGIGANTAAFSIVNAWLLRPLPLKDPQHLVAIWRTRAEAPRQPAYFNLYHDYLVWAAQNRSFDSLGATFEQRYALIGAGEPQQLEGAIATWNLFSTVGAKPAMGRLFVADDVRGEPACIISHALWAKQFHSSRDVIGQSIALNGKLYRILGVLPANFSLRVLDRPFETEVWTLITADDPNYSAASPAAMAVVGRLKPGVTAAQAEADLAGIQRELDKRFTGPRNSGVLAVNLQQDNTRTIRSSTFHFACTAGRSRTHTWRASRRASRPRARPWRRSTRG